LKGRPNSLVVLTVERAPGIRLQRKVTTRSLPPALAHPTFAQSVIMQSLLSYPWFFLVVGMAVLFFRPRDRNAWLLAFMFIGFIALAGWVNSESEPMVPIAIRRFALTFQFVFQVLLPPLFYYFFAVFPVPSPLDRRIPWLKNAFIGIVALIELPIAFKIASLGSYVPVYECAEFAKRWIDPRAVSAIYTVGAFVLGLVSLAWNGWRAPTADARRKIRVLALGTAAGLLPLLAMTFFVIRSGKDASPLNRPFYSWVLEVVGLTFLPLSFAYAVVKYRVMELPVLLKRSARYLLVRRGSALFITLASMGAAWVFVRFFFQFFPWLFAPGRSVVVTIGMAGAGVGGLLAVATAHIQQGVRQRLDRAFFRSEYDARQILEDLAERIRSTQNSQQLAELLEEQITQALHPRP
jgi:two-component system NtrC family sensor kinase